MDCSLDFLPCLGRLLGISQPSVEMECDHLALLGSLFSKEKEWESWNSAVSTSTYYPVQVFFGVVRVTQRMAYCLVFLIESPNSRIPLIHSPLILHKRNLCRKQDATMLVKKLSANQHWSAQGPDRLHWACSCSSGLVSDVQLLNQVLEFCLCQCDWS